jgi:hypothetical protein
MHEYLANNFVVNQLKKLKPTQRNCKATNQNCDCGSNTRTKPSNTKGTKPIHTNKHPNEADQTNHRFLNAFNHCIHLVPHWFCLT